MPVQVNDNAESVTGKIGFVRPPSTKINPMFRVKQLFHDIGVGSSTREISPMTALTHCETRNPVVLSFAGIIEFHLTALRGRVNFPVQPFIAEIADNDTNNEKDEFCHNLFLFVLVGVLHRIQAEREKIP